MWESEQNEGKKENVLKASRKNTKTFKNKGNS